MKTSVRRWAVCGAMLVGLAIVGGDTAGLRGAETAGINPAARFDPAARLDPAARSDVAVRAIVSEGKTVVYPRYLLLDARTAPTRHGPIFHPGLAQRRPAQAYAYGWFGAKSAPRKTIHRGFYSELWIWHE
jgi:hypothetical protein